MNFTGQKSLKLSIPPREIETPYCVKMKPHTGVSPMLGRGYHGWQHQALALADPAHLSILLYICDALTYVTFCGSDLVVLLFAPGPHLPTWENRRRSCRNILTTGRASGIATLTHELNSSKSTAQRPDFSWRKLTSFGSCVLVSKTGRRKCQDSHSLGSTISPFVLKGSARQPS